ncbi:MAG: exodeoxyribonuclease V subunit beta [Methylovulum sp.]|nr:exodeoxyribonuclease V subunit beta [Methylovulum sp.]
MQTDYFDPVRTELHNGINLIEASAGTGKTYTLAMLVLRFVVERGVAIENILVVTFTKAATEELKERVRTSLGDAKKALAGHTEAIDSTIIAWLAQLDIEPELIRERLVVALLDIDRAGILTIHGFCQRVLREHALESGQVFDAELMGDLTAIKQGCADDFWRRQIYPRSLWEASVLTADYKTPDQLLASLAGFPSAGMALDSRLCIHPDEQNLEQALNRLKQCAEDARQVLEATAGAVMASFAGQKFKSGYSDAFELHYCALAAWLQGETVEIPVAEAFALLTTGGLLDGLHGNKFRTTKTQSGEQRKADYLAGLAIDTAPFDALDSAYQNIPLIIRRLLLETLRVELSLRLQQLNVLSFDDLISRLSEALQGDKAGLLVAELQQRFAVALIDEFQDTDDSQWFIFSSVFASAGHAVYLVGDPKQAIYKFRGADIYSYLKAQEQAEHRYTLDKNWRSHPQLVAAVNALFQREQAFLLDDLEFSAVHPARTAGDGELVVEGEAQAPMVLWQLPESESSTGYWTAGKAADAIRSAVVNEIIALLGGDYRLQPAGRALQPKDIAILVRTNTQAREYQAALHAVGVPSVLNSIESVFATQEAADLYTLLQAVASPGDSLLLKQVLALDWFGMDGQALYRLINNEAALDQWLSSFVGYFQDWQHKGLMAMMLNVLGHKQIRANLAKTAMAERRMTNLHHLIELVQQAAVDEHLGINKTLDWLRTAIIKAGVKAGNDENQQLRLESDDDAVKIVTMHRSKGLEYPVVFCPYLWQRSDRLRSEKHLITCHADGGMVVDLGSRYFEQHREQALYEELAEDLRVCYVAVTRAKYRCYLVWADVRSGQVANGSALAWLLAFADEGYSVQQAILRAFSERDAQAFAYRQLTVSDAVGGIYKKTVVHAELSAKKLSRSLHTSWQMSSYTALSALSLQDAPELPEDKTGEQYQAVGRERPVDDGKVETGPIQGMEQRSGVPKGVQTGNAVHDLLEHIPFIHLAMGKDIAAQRDRVCQRYGVRLDQPELLDELLRAVVTTPLSDTDPDFCLMNLPERQCLKEMPFYLALQAIDAGQINPILEGSPAYQPLSSKQMRGFLTGFVDLICAYQGRYYVMDYKTNSLPDYGEAGLLHAMRAHNYGLQYWLYTVVLHRYLQNRLPDYDYETHFGGVRYLFVRGMQPDVVMAGVFQDRPDYARVDSLAGLFYDDK